MDREHEALLRLRDVLDSAHGTTEEKRAARRAAYDSLRNASKRLEAATGGGGGKRGRHEGEGKGGKKKKKEKKEKKRKYEKEGPGSRGGAEGGSGSRKLDKRLLECASAGDAKSCSEIMAQGARADCQDKTGCTPLHWAALYGHVGVLRLLLAGGGARAALDTAAGSGSTPLHYACLGGHAEAAVALARAGANRFAVNSSVGLGRLEAEVAKDERMDRLTDQRAAAARAASASAAWELGEGRRDTATDHHARWQAYEGAWENVAAAAGGAGVAEGAGEDGGGGGGGAGGGLTLAALPDPHLWGRGAAGGDPGPLILVSMQLPPKEMRRAVRAELLRWHPDKFEARFGAALAAAGPEEAKAIREYVNRVASQLNSLQ